MGAEAAGGDRVAFHINQRHEVIPTGDVSGTLLASQNMQMQTFVAAFNAGAGSKAGGISYSSGAAPTLKGAPSGNSMPSVLCLNDQGGSMIDCSKDVSGTLRSQEHGHQPAVLLYDNNGMDGRYTGPHDTAPTVSAHYGTGGNNVPLVKRETFCITGNAIYSRQRTDVFKESDVASTQSARQCKDATDLVYQATVGALTSSDSKGPNSQYVNSGKLVVEGPKLIRRLLPTECERLQGFDPGWTDIPGASDSARYRALGNSVAIPCVDHIMRGIVLAAAKGGDG